MLSVLLPLLLLAPAQDETPLERALARMAIEGVAADIRFLADDELAGRDTPSVGLEVAANFIEARLRRLGLEPAGRDGFRQSFPLVVRRLDPERTGLVARAARPGGAEVRFSMGEQYFPERLAHLVGWDVAADAISVGFGQEAERVGVEIEGRWAVVFDQGQAMRPIYKELAAAGAAGALVTPSAEYKGNTYVSRFENAAHSMLDGLTTRPTGRGPSGPELPVVMVSRDGWDRIAATLGWDARSARPDAGVELGLHLHDRRTPIDPDASASNVIARLTGAEPALAREVIVVVAHYDAAGVSRGRVNNGADDNASGTAAALAVAEGLVAHGAPSRSVVFLWTAGNAKDRMGAEAWARAPTLREGERVVLAIELDALGLGERGTIFAGPGPSSTWHSDWVGRFVQCATLEQFPLVHDGDPTWARCEARVLAETLEIPTVSVTAGRDKVHRTSRDDALALRTGKITRAARAVLRLVVEAGG